MSGVLRPLLARIQRRLPLPLQSILIGLLAGLLVWLVLDRVQPNAVRDIFVTELEDRLNQRAREGLIRFENHVALYVATTRLLANHGRLANYLEPLYWFASDARPLQVHTSPPRWLPAETRLDALVHPGYILLLDGSERVREVYQLAPQPLPAEFQRYLSLYLSESSFQGYLTTLDGSPFLLVSEEVRDRAGAPMGRLMLVSPLDDQFLADARQGAAFDESVAALLDADAQRLLASSDPEYLPAGIEIAKVEPDYLVTAQSFFHIEGSDLNMQYATLLPRHVVDDTTEQVLNLERRQRLLTSVVFVAVFVFVIFLFSQRISTLLKRKSRLAQQALGLHQPVDEQGNQLMVLEEWLDRFIHSVRVDRDQRRHRHESEIRESELLTQAIMEAALDSIVTVDEAGRIVAVNSTAERMFGIRREAAAGELMAERMIAPLSRSGFLALLDAARAHPEAVEETLRESRVELEGARQGDGTFPVELGIRPIRMSNRLLFTVYLRDLTPQRMAERKAREHQQELVHVCRLSTMGEMSTGLAHELNQPLAAIANYASGSVRRLRGGMGDPQAIVEALQQIQLQADRAGEIIRRLRALVGKQPPIRTSVDLNELVREVCLFVEFLARRAGVRIEQEPAPEPLRVRVDLVQIEQVLLNLVRNGIDALEQCGGEPTITLRTGRRPDGELTIEVEDNGPGLTAEAQERLFEPFYTTKSKGMGIGLAISRTIMEDHRGRIEVSSKPGGPTRFVLVLPDNAEESMSDGEEMAA